MELRGRGGGRRMWRRGWRFRIFIYLFWEVFRSLACVSDAFLSVPRGHRLGEAMVMEHGIKSLSLHSLPLSRSFLPLLSHSPAFAVPRNK